MRFISKIRKIDKRWAFAVAAMLISIAAILTSGHFGQQDETNLTYAQYTQSRYNIVKTRVITTDDSRLSPDPYIENMRLGVQPITLEILSGPYEGEVHSINNTMSRAYNIDLKPGMDFLSIVHEEDGILQGIDVYGYSRDTVIYWLIAVFCLTVVVIGHKKGLYSLISLAFTLVLIIFFLIPRIIEGYNPILMAIITAALTTAATIFIVAGTGPKSCSAIIGVVLGVAIAGLTAVIAGTIGNISGINAQESSEIVGLSQDAPIKVRELFFAGIIIAALGAVLDIGMSISSSIFEIKQADPTLGMRELYKKGMNIGRDIIGTMTNTLILAFAGSSMAILIIITMYRLPYLRLINLDIVGLEIIQGVAGSIGLTLTVPITALSAACLAARKTKQKPKLNAPSSQNRSPS